MLLLFSTFSHPAWYKHFFHKENVLHCCHLHCEVIVGLCCGYSMKAWHWPFTDTFWSRDLVNIHFLYARLVQDDFTSKQSKMNPFFPPPTPPPRPLIQFIIDFYFVLIIFTTWLNSDLNNRKHDAAYQNCLCYLLEILFILVATPQKYGLLI